MPYFVYIMTNQRNGTLYTGMTNNVIRRTHEHREGFVESFTKRYGLKRLVYYEQHATVFSAKARENSIKGWPRKWKIELIEEQNPNWQDLWEHVILGMPFE